jgi:DNA repair protein RecO
MSHHIYQTKAFIIDSVDVGEANKLLTVFTADLGLIYVSAQGVRIMKSKLRQSIQDLSYSKIALVRGKEYWRLTSAEKLISLYDKRVDLRIRKLMARVLMFVKRLTTGEAKHEELFDMLSKLFTFCFENSRRLNDPQLEIQGDQIFKALELIVNFRILESLGYGSDDSGFDEIRNLFDWNMDLVMRIHADTEKSKKIESHIRHAIMNSHL